MGTLVEGERKVHRTTEIAAGLCHMGTMGARGPECRSINPAGVQICHARENRRGMNERERERELADARTFHWQEERVQRGEVPDQPRRQDAKGDRTRLVGLRRRRRVNTKAPRRFTTPRYLGRCLTYPRLSGTQAIFTPPAA